MKKPENAEPGWYEDPEESVRERFWNGKYWDKSTRLIGEDVPTPLPISEFELGPLLFRRPFGRDYSLTTYLILLGLSSILGVYSEFQSGTRIELIPILLVPVFPLLAIYLYLFFLPYLLIRRRRDKKRGLQKGSSEFKTEKPKKKIFIGVASIVGVWLGLSALGGIVGQDSDIDEFLEYQQKISGVLNKYNTEAAVAVGVVRDLSDGVITIGDGIAKFSASASRTTPILRELREECDGLPFPDLTGSGEKLAYAKAMNMLWVTCEVTPQQFLVLQQIFAEQVSDSASQLRLNELSSKLTSLGRMKTDAAIEGIRAFLPYANEQEKESLNQLLDAFSNR
jgi:hypothetical protein